VLRSNFRAAVARQKAAGRAIAALIGTQGLGMSVTGAQQQGGVTRVLAGLRRLRISPARLAHLTGTQLKPAPSDALAGL
jgi:hypothetical protein